MRQRAHPRTNATTRPGDNEADPKGGDAEKDARGDNVERDREAAESERGDDDDDANTVKVVEEDVKDDGRAPPATATVMRR